MSPRYGAIVPAVLKRGAVFRYCDVSKAFIKGTIESKNLL